MAPASEVEQGVWRPPRPRSSPELICLYFPPRGERLHAPHNDLFSWRWKIMSFASKLSAVIFYNC